MRSSKDERQYNKRRNEVGRISIKSIKYTVAKFFIVFEKRCFGWHYEGNDVSEIDYGYETTYTVYDNYVSANTTHKTEILKYAYFARPKCYPINFLFGLFEILSRFVSWIGRWVFNAIPVWLIVGILLAVFASTYEVLTIGGAIYGALYGARLLFALLGLICRKGFHLDDKCDDLMEDYGYSAWTSDAEGTYK